MREDVRSVKARLKQVMNQSRRYCSGVTPRRLKCAYSAGMCLSKRRSYALMWRRICVRFILKRLRKKCVFRRFAKQRNAVKGSTQCVTKKAAKYDMPCTYDISLSNAEYVCNRSIKSPWKGPQGLNSFVSG